MVIGRGCRREDPNQHVVLLLLRKKYGKKSTEKKVWKKKYGEKIREKRTGKSTGKKVRPFRLRDFVTSGEKGPTRADIAQRPVAHAQNIIPNMASSSHVTSGSSSSLLRKCDLNCAHILLVCE
jgi:hypothetical protein